MENHHRFDVGGAVRRLRLARPGVSIEAAADYAEMSCAGRWGRLERQSTNLDRWLTDLDQAARYLGVSVADLVELARVPAGIRRSA